MLKKALEFLYLSQLNHLFMLKTILGLLFIIPFIFSCKNANTVEKKQSSPFKMIKYYVRYIEQNKQAQFEAKFYNEKDSAFPVSGGVFISDNKLEAKNLPREGWIHRHIKRPASFDSTYIFSVNFSKDQIFKDSVKMPVYPDFKLATPKLSKKTGGLITWTGNALGQEDGLTLLFEDNEGLNFTNNHVGITRGPQFEIRPEVLAGLKKGKVVIRAVHKRTTVDKSDNTRKVVLTEYYRIPFEAEIVD